MTGQLHLLLQEQISKCTDPDFARRFHVGCPVPGATDTDYLQRVVQTSDDRRFLAGIRFRRILSFFFSTKNWGFPTPPISRSERS